jgi:hypothetical protein
MPMRWRGLGLSVLLLLAACGGWPFWTQGREERARDKSPVPPHVHVEFLDVQYDGITLTGRVLISPEGKPLRLDKRLTPTVDVDVQTVADCLRQPHAYLRMDFIPLRAREEDILNLNPGYWYGATVGFTLFDEYFTGIGPECIDARLLIFSFDGQLVAGVPIRAVRPPLPETDGGVPEGLRHLLNNPAFSDLKKLPEVDLSEVPEADGGVSPPPP